MSNASQEVVDLTRPFRGVEDLGKLVAFVYDADPKNETNWLEWKRGLDLTAKGGRFEAAKHILGFVNRSPDTARHYVRGLAYLVLGAEPGNVPGQPPMDPAELVAALRPYIGSQGPKWAPLWVSFRACQVLVVTVEAPQWGDPFHTLQQGYENFEAGAIFIRHHGRTDRAGPDDIQMLTDRATRVQPLDIVISADEGLLCALDTSPAQVEAWLDAERERLLFPLQKEKMERLRDEQAHSLSGLSAARFGVAGLAAQAAAAAQVADAISGQFYGRLIPEDRTEQGYFQEIESYLDETRPVLAQEAIRAFSEDRCSHLSLIVDNPTERNIPEIQIRLTFGPDVTPYSDGREEVFLPTPPRLWGPRREGGVAELVAALVGKDPVYSLPGILRGPVTSVIEPNVSGHTVTYWVGHLRPCETFKALPVALLIDPSANSPIMAGWTATSKGIDGVLRGELRVPIGEACPLKDYLPKLP